MVNWGFRGMKISMIIDFDIEGFHYYPKAPKEVDFLRFEHRHLFRVKCGVPVTHDNREKEIFIHQDAVKKYLKKKYGNPCRFNQMSCEMIAKDVLEEFNCSWVDVLEDNRGGARVCK
jgi:hypothetical protein|tara:strand:- start:102 stop:452 length:351 start_codon:yes stop_codon:yes gene_type:complete